VAADVLRLETIQSNKRGSPARKNGDAHGSCDGITPISPPRKKPHQCVDRRTPLPDDAMAELKNHYDLLDEILRPIYLGTSSKLRSGERRVLGHLMSEIGVLIKQLSR